MHTFSTDVASGESFWAITRIKTSLGLRPYHILFNIWGQKGLRVGAKSHTRGLNLTFWKHKFQILREDSLRLVVTCYNHWADSKFPHFLCSSIYCFRRKHGCYSAPTTPIRSNLHQKSSTITFHFHRAHLLTLCFRLLLILMKDGTSSHEVHLWSLWMLGYITEKNVKWQLYPRKHTVPW